MRPSGGYDPADVRNVVVRGGETATLDVPLNRNWASLAGGGSIASSNDDTGEPFCGPTAMIDDQDGGLGWSAFNPTGPFYPDELSGDAPTTTIRLPRAVDISAIGIDPAATCGDGASAALKGYKLEVSSDGSTFRTFSEGEFTAAQAGNLNLLDATGDLGKGVRQVRLTLLSPQNDNEGFSGDDFIDVTSLEVFGAPASELPPASPDPTPATPPPPPPSPGAPPGATPKPLPVITIARSGSRGRFTIRVTCAQRCRLSGKVTVTKSLARKLHRKRLTVRTLRRTITSTARRTIRVKLSKALVASLKKRGLKSLRVRARFTATYADGRKRTASRRLRVRR